MEKLRNIIDPGHKRDESIMYGTGNPDNALEDLHDGNRKTTTSTTTGSGIHGSTHQHQPGHHDIHPHQSTTTHHDLKNVSRPGPTAVEDPSSIASIKSGVQGHPPMGSTIIPASGVSSTTTTTSMTGDRAVPLVGAVATSPATSHTPGFTEPKSTIFTKGPHITDTGNRLDPQVNEGGFTLSDPVPLKSTSVTDGGTGISGSDTVTGHRSHGAGIGTAAAATGATGASTGIPYSRTTTDDRITKPVDIEKENELAASRPTGVGSDGLGAYETKQGVYYTKPSTTGTTSHINPLSSTTHSHNDTTASGTSGLGAGAGAAGVAGIGSQAVSSKFHEGPANTAVLSNPATTTTTKKTITTDIYEPAGTMLVDRTVEPGSESGHRGGLFGHKDKHNDDHHQYDHDHHDHHDEKKKHGGLVSSLLHRHHHQKDHKDDGHYEHHEHSHEKGSGYSHSPTSTTGAVGNTGTYGTVGDTNLNTNKTSTTTHHPHNHRVDEVPATEAAKPYILPDEHGHKKLHKEPPVGGV